MRTAGNLPGTNARITFTDLLPAMTPAEGNYDLLKLLNEASRDLGLGTVEPLDPGERGAGDIGYISHLLPSLDGIGISGGNAHAPGEYADLDSLPNLTKRSALLIYLVKYFRLHLPLSCQGRSKIAHRFNGG